MIKAVFFDLDGTLYDRDALVQELVADQYDVFESLLPGLSRDQFIGRIVEMDDHGYGDKHRGYERVAEEWRLSTALAAALLEHFWSRYDQYCRLSTDTEATLRQLKSADLRLGVITNGATERQTRKLDALGLLATMDVVLISEAEGVRKPLAEIFDRALQRVGVRSAEAIFVGDHPDVDVGGARDAGLLPIWKYVPYWRPPVPAVVTVDNLSEILPHCLGR